MAANPFSDPEFGADAAKGAKPASKKNPFSDPEFGKEPKRTWGEAAKDTGAAVMGGLAGLVKTGGDLYGLASGNMDNAASELGRNAQEYWSDAKSQALQTKIAQRKANIDAQESTLGKAWTAVKDTLTDPALAADTVAENVATMLPGAGVGRAVGAAKYARGFQAASEFGPASLAAREAIAKQAGKYATGAAIGTGAVQQGADVSGDIYGDLMKKTDAEWDASPDFQAALQRHGGDRQAAKSELANATARAAFLPTAGISVAANAIPGATYLERALVGAPLRTGAKEVGRFGAARGFARGVLGEGGQEFVEEGGGRLGANLAAQQQAMPGHDTWDGVGENAGMGFAGGALLGVGGGVHGAREAMAQKRAQDAAKGAEDGGTLGTPAADTPPADVPPGDGQAGPGGGLGAPTGAGADMAGMLAPANPLLEAMNQRAADPSAIAPPIDDGKIFDKSAAAPVAGELYQPGDTTNPLTGERITAKPSEAMGINPADGPLSTGAALAVDTGVSEQMQQAAALAEAVKAAPKTPAGEAKTAAPDLSGWSDQQLSDTFRAAQAPDVRRQLAVELSRRRDVREQQALRQEMDAEQAAMDMQDAPDDAFANVREDAGAPNLQDGPSHSVADGVADKGRQPTVSQQPKEASSGTQAQETQQAGAGQQEARAGQAGARDESHLNALELRLSHERGRLRAAKTDAERATRQVTVDGIEREIAGERKFLGLAPQAASAMSDDALMQALKPDGAEKTSTAQPPLSGTISPQPQAAGPALAAPEFTTIKTVHGDSVTVRTSDLQGDAPRLRQYTKAGKAKAVPAIHRDNLDLTGEKSAERAKENAKNPLFHTVTTKDGGAFASQAAAQREVNRLGLQDSHEVVEAGGGFVGRIKKTGEQHGATARNLRLADERTPGAGAAAPHGPGESVAGEAPVVGAGQRQTGDAGRLDGATTEQPVSSLFTGKPDPINSAPLRELDGFKVGDAVDVPGRTIGRSTIEVLFTRDVNLLPMNVARIVSADGKRLDVVTSELAPVDSVAAVAAAANEAATSPENDLPEPTDAQKAAGNYKMGHLSGDAVQGLNITIENPKGSTRSGKDSDGETWQNTMAAHYGYVKGSEAADGDHVDIFVGPDAATAPTVWVVDQVNPDGTYDEAKALFGFNTENEAVAAYKGSYDKGWKVGPITALSVDEFKVALADGRLKKPLNAALRQQKKAPAEDQAMTGLRRQLREVEDKIMAAAPASMAKGGGDIEAAMKSRAVPVTLKAQRKKLKDQIQQAQSADGSQSNQPQAQTQQAQAATENVAPDAEQSPVTAINKKQSEAEKALLRLAGLKGSKLISDDGRGRKLFEVKVTPEFRNRHFVNGLMPMVDGLELKEKSAVTGNVYDDGYILIDNREQLASRRAAAPNSGVEAQAQETTYNGTRIYPTKIKVGDEVKSMWAVESPDNRRRRAAGERTIGGDSLHDTIEQAKAAAEREAKRDAEQRAAKAEQDAADKARLDAEEARKAANRPKTVVERRKDAILDGPSKIGQGTKRAVITTAVDNGYAIEAKMVYDHAAKKRDQEAVDRASRAGYILGVSNENLPLVKAGNEAKARLKEGKYEKPEYRVYQGSDTKAPFREITKTEYDYAQELKAQRAAAPQAEAAQPATPQQDGNDFLPEGWTKSVNGFTKRPVYRMEQGVGQPFAVVTQTDGMTYEVQIRHGDKQLTVGTQRGALSEVLAAAKAELGRMKRADSVTHADPGEKAEAATPAVVTDSLKKAASNEDTKPSEMRKWLVAEIDKELLQAPDRADYDEAVKRLGEKDAISMFTGNGPLGKNSETGFITFDVPGDGKYKVRNSVRGLLEFRKNVMASSGFKDSGQKQVKPEQNRGVQGGSGGSMAAITNMIEEGDFEAARDYAEAVGVKLEDVKVPRGDMKPAWEKYLKDGTLPPAPDTRQKPAPKTAAQLDEEKRQAAEAEAKKPKDTGWNMAGTGYGGKRYIGRNITLDDGREVVARVYENAGTYEEAEVKVDGVRKFTVTDRDNAQGKADAFIRTLQDGDQAAGSAKSPTRVTPQISGNPEKFIKVAADSVRELRSVDVDRVLTETPVQFRAEVAGYIRDQRKDLADEVDDVMADIQPMAAAPAPAPATTGARRDPAKVSMFNPYEDGDIVTINGQDWTVKQDTPGWYLTTTGNWRGQHPTIRNVKAMADLIREVEQAAEAKPASAGRTYQSAYDAEVERMHELADKKGVPASGINDDLSASLASLTIGRGFNQSPDEFLSANPAQKGRRDAMVAWRNGQIDHKPGQSEWAKRREKAQPAAESDTPKLTQSEAKELMEWQDLGQKDGIKTHILTFYESKADKDAKRGRMIVAKVTKGDRSASNWMVDGDDKPLAVLGMAKKRAEEIGMAKAVADGFVAEDNPFAEYNALAKQYGYEVRPDGAIGSDGKFPGPKMKVKGGRLRIESGSGNLLASYASPAPQSLGKFLESFWYAQKKAPVDGAGKTAEPASDRDHFTLERLNRETDRMEPVTFQRGETVKIAAGKRPYPTGVITGISHAERKFRVDGNEYGHDFGYAYKVDFDELARPRQEVDASLNTLEQRLNEGNAIQSEGFIRSAKEVIERNNLGDYAKDRMTQLARRAADVSKSVLDKMRAAKAEKEQADAQKRAEDQAKVAEPKPPIEMTMDEWKAVSKDFKGMIDGKRTVMREGGMRFVTIIPSKAADSKTPTVDAHDALMASVREGRATPEQFKSGFEAVVAGKEAIKAELSAKTKAQLLEVGGPQVQWRHANSTKPDIVDAIYREMLRDYALGETITHGLARDSYQNAVRRLVEATDADKLAQFVKEREAALEESKTRREATAKAMENPQTLDDFRALMRAKVTAGMSQREAFLSLTPEQRIRYDDLAAESTRAAREANKQAQKTQVQAAGQTTGGEIIETKHTRDGYDLFVVQLADRLSKEDYQTVAASAKKLGGWYSSFRGNGATPGFQFKDRANAEAFLKLAGGDTGAAQEQVGKLRDAFEDDRSQTAAQRLSAMADKLESSATEEENRDRKTNTGRRARFARAALDAAASDKALAKTMRNIAKAIESGRAKFLDMVRTKTQVDFLANAVKTAKDAELRAKYPSYADQEKRKGEPATAETADHADFPSYSAFRSDLAMLARHLLEVDGTKKLGQRLMSVADDVTDAYMEFAKENLSSVSQFGTKRGGLAEYANREAAERAIRRSGLTGRAIVLPIKRGENRIILSPSEAINKGIWTGDGDKRITLTRDFGNELVQSIGRRGNRQNKLAVPWQFQNAHDRLKMLERMGIQTSSEFRAALREFIGLKEEAVQNRARTMELEMVGRKADGLDFFPTPATVADQMVEAADLTPDMAVLEPSAGMGHLADRIRAAGAEPDVIEMSGERRELLEEKGYHLAEVDDFMRMEPRKFFTYGDVFRAPDGTEGVMMGGEMGSSRVMLRPLKPDGTPDMRLGEFYDREDLTGIRHRGTESGYDRIIMNPPFSNRRDAEHVRHAYSLLRPGGRIVAIMGEGVFFGSDKKAQDFRDWLESVGGTSEKLPEGSFMDASLPVNTGVNARMVVIDKPAGDMELASRDDQNTANYAANPARRRAAQGTPTDRAVMDMTREGKSAQDILRLIAGTSKSRFNRQVARLLLRTGVTPKVEALAADGLGKDKRGFNLLAKYSRDSNTISLTEGAGYMAEQIMLHELIHAATLRALDRKGLASLQMRLLFEHVQKHGGLAGTYGMKNVGEFVSEAFTNPDFQRALRQIAAPPGGRIKAAWDGFVRILRSILGLPNDSHDALSQALQIGVAVMREDMGLRARSSGEGLASPAVIAHGKWPGASKAAKEAFDRIVRDGVTSPDDLQKVLAVPGYSQWARSAIVRDVGATKALRNELDALYGQDWRAPKLNDQGAISLYDNWDQLNSETIREVNALAERYGAPVIVRGGASPSDATRKMLAGAGYVPYLGMTERIGRRASVLVSMIRPGGGITRTTPMFFGDTPRAMPANSGARRDAMAGIDQTQTEAFKRWFGDSKVVDAEGKPLASRSSLVAARKSAMLEGRMNGGSSNAKSIADLLVSQAFSLKGLGGLEIPAQRKVLNGVLSLGDDFKVLRSVVDLVPVDVVNILTGKNLAPEVLFRDEAMLKQLLSADRDGSVSTAIDIADALVVAVAGVAAKGSAIASNPFAGTQKVGSAADTGNADVLHDAILNQTIGNNGNFDPEDADIAHFGAAELRGLKDNALDRINTVMSHPGKVSLWDKTVGTMRNLAERAPAFKPVFEAAQRFIDDVALLANDAADMAPRVLPRVDTWRDLAKKPISAADNKAVAKPLFEGTLLWARDANDKPVLVSDLEKRYANLPAEDKAQMMLKLGKLDAGVLRMWQGLPLEQFEALVESRFESQMLKAGVVWTDKELADIFKATPHQIGLYRETRKAIDRSIDMTARADMLRVLGQDFAGLRDMVLEQDSLGDAMELLIQELADRSRANPDDSDRLTGLHNAIVDRANKARDLMDAGYAPLTRFGRYTVDVVDANGERQYFGMYESRGDANRARMQLQSEFPGATVTQGTMSQQAFKLFAGITPESLELFGNMLGLDEEGGEARDKAFQEYLKLTKNNHSALKRLIHRQGIAGFSEDVGRVLASFVYSNARQAAGALNAGTMERAVNDIPKEQGELKDVAMGLREYIRDPQEEGQAVRGMLFAQYLGGSVASAFVNMTQPFAVTMPWLSQYGGIKSAGAQLAKALKDMGTKGFKYEADLAAALKHAEDDGVVSPQEIHQLMAQARGSGSLRSGDGTRVGEARAAAANAWERTKVAWGQPFALAEQFNRRSTFIAAYRIAKEQKMADPAAFARRAVEETQFVYSKAAKSRWMRGAIGGTLMTFKSYSIQYLELLHRMWTQGGPEGKRAVGWAMVMLMLAGGAGGLPFMEDLEDLIDGIAQLMGYNVSSKQWRQRALRDVLGKEFAEFMEQGVSGLPGAPVDVSGRLGLGNLIPGTGLLLQKPNRERDLLEVAGPAGDLFKRGFTGGRKLLAGDVGGAALEVSPTAVRNAVKGADMAASGMYKDAKGYKVIDTTLGEALAKAGGFQPRSVAQVQEANSFMMRSRSFYQQNSAEIKAQWADALFRKDEAALERVRERLAAWNRDNPEQPIVVKMPDVWKRVREMGKDRTQRIADTAPKALRQQMREMARENG